MTKDKPTKIIPISAFKDNYIWAIHSPDDSEIIVVDHGDAAPVVNYLEQHALKLKAILVTHHHWDHSGGIPDLKRYITSVSVYGPAHESTPIAGITQFVDEGDKIDFPSFGISFNVMNIPGHTRDHVAYFNEEMLFCGDTLFSCGCGRVFEGTPTQMLSSLEKLKKLPINTAVFCGHEYTLANIDFAKVIEPHNADLQLRYLEAKTARENNLPTLPCTLESELKINPFLRCEKQSVIDAVRAHIKNDTVSDPVTIFAHLREWKNQYR